MKTVTNINLPSSWKLVTIGVNEHSPMKKHQGGEIAVDSENRVFYIHEIFLVTYGTDSVVKACDKYLKKADDHLPV